MITHPLRRACQQSSRGWVVHRGLYRGPRCELGKGTRKSLAATPRALSGALSLWSQCGVSPYVALTVGHYGSAGTKASNNSGESFGPSGPRTRPLQGNPNRETRDYKGQNNGNACDWAHQRRQRNRGAKVSSCAPRGATFVAYLSYGEQAKSLTETPPSFVCIIFKP
jgi:hypothetical protein